MNDIKFNILLIFLSLPMLFQCWKNRKNKAFLIFFAVIIFVFLGINAGFAIWRSGTIVAKAEFNPSIAPFSLTVRKVPVPVTQSSHFIVELRRGQYPVTSFRYFWLNYTPTNIKISWPQLESFEIIFDDKYIASCEWNWGKQAIWKITGPSNAQIPGDKP